jgi:hypothetical protein
MTLEQLLRMEIKGKSPVSKEDISYPPEFRVAVQSKTDDGVHIIIHANGHNSETLDFIVRGNKLLPMKYLNGCDVDVIGEDNGS